MGKEMAKIFKEKWVKTVGIPKVLLSDNGKQFCSSYFRSLCQSLNIVQRFTTPYNPTGNAITERINATVGQVMRCSRELSLEEALQKVRQAVNYGYHRMLGTSPIVVLTGKTPLDPLNRATGFDYKHSESIQRSEKKRDLDRKNKTRSNNFKYMIGDLVYKRKPTKEGKLSDLFEEPYRITKTFANPNVFEIENDYNTSLVNIKRLKPFIQAGGKMSCSDLVNSCTDKSYFMCSLKEKNFPFSLKNIE